MAWFFATVLKMHRMIVNERAFFIEDLKAVVIADIHLGYELELREAGINIRNQTFHLKNTLKKIISETDAERVIIVGDVKHNITGPTKALQDFFENLDVEIIAVKGNHDGNLEEFVDFKVYPPTGIRIGKYGFFHGHCWPDEDVMRAKYVFMGHLHPEIALTDSIGKVHKYPCHLLGTLNDAGKKKFGSDPKLFVISAFNPLVGSALGTPIGPIFKNGLVEDMDVYLLNGVYLKKYSISAD